MPSTTRLTAHAALDTARAPGVVKRAKATDDVSLVPPRPMPPPRPSPPPPEATPPLKSTPSSATTRQPQRRAPAGRPWRSVSMLSAAADVLAAWLLALLSAIVSLALPRLRRLLLRTLSFGPVPRHIAFIMDGNRRWAKTRRTPLPVREGHLTGFSALRAILEACLELKGLDTVSVYAFAIDNFARSEEEVNALMDIAKKNLVELAAHGEVLARHSVRLRIVGRKELLPTEVRAAVERVERMTAANRKATLNVCIPYASRDEMAGAVRDVVEGRMYGRDDEDCEVEDEVGFEEEEEEEEEEEAVEQEEYDGEDQNARLRTGDKGGVKVKWGAERSSWSEIDGRCAGNSCVDGAGDGRSESATSDASSEAKQAGTFVDAAPPPPPPPTRRLAHVGENSSGSPPPQLNGGAVPNPVSFRTRARRARSEERRRRRLDEALEARMLFAHSPKLDVLVRTSGVHRLSDFMLWQCHEDTQLYFTARYWPLFGLRELVPIVLSYQRAVWRRRLREKSGR